MSNNADEFRLTFLKRSVGTTVAVLIFTGDREEIRKAYEGEIRDVLNAGLPQGARCTLVSRKLLSLTTGEIADEDKDRCRVVPAWMADQCDALLDGPKLWRPSHLPTT